MINIVKHLIDIANSPIVLLNHDGVITYANDLFNEVAGNTYDTFIGKSVSSISNSFYETHLKTNVFDEELNFDFNVSNKSVSNTFKVKVQRLGAHEVEGYLLIFDNSELELDFSSFDDIFRKNAIPMIVSRFDTGVFVEANDLFIELSGLQKEEIIGRTSIELGVFNEKERKVFLDLLKENGNLHNYEMNVHLYDRSISALISAHILDNRSHKYILISIADITQQKKVEQQLQENKELFREIVERMPAMVLEMQTSGEITFANSCMLDKFGYSLTDIYNGLSFTDLFVLKEHKRLLEDLSKFEFEEPVEPIEYIAEKANGEEFDCLVYSARMVLHNEYVGIRSVMLDITKLKRYQHNLQKSEERLELALEGANQGLWDWNILSGEVYFNDRWQSMLGYRDGEIEGTLDSWRKLIHPDDLHFVVSDLNNHLEGKTKLYRTEHRMLTKEKQWIWVLDTGKVLEYNDKGEPIRVVGTLIDINFVKNAELNLKKSLNRQEILSEFVITINSIKDYRSKINRALERIGQHMHVSRVYIFENNDDGTLTSNTYEWCNDNISSRIMELQNVPYTVIDSWKKALLTNGSFVVNDVRNLQKDLAADFYAQGIKSHVSIPIYVKDNFIGFIGFDECSSYRIWLETDLEFLRTITGIVANTFEQRGIDISLRKAKVEADIANRAKSEFLASMSHEIRTPLNAILGISEALVSSLDDNYIKTKIKTIYSSGTTLLALINDILDLSKIEAGKLDLMYMPVNLHKTIEEIVTLFENKADQKGLSLKFDYKNPDYKTFDLDETRIRQVLFNLVGNAIKFTEEGEVSVTVYIQKTTNSLCSITIEVIDTGIGIASDQQKVIFDSFRQQSGQSNKKYGGTGLGLAISKKLVDLMNGKILLKSNVGVGSEFVVFLPGIKIVEQEKKEMKTKVDIFHTVDFEDATILVVDDIRINVDTITLLNKCKSLNFIGKYSGEAALEWLEDNTPNLILLDIKMPKLDGWETLKKIRENHKNKDIPIVAYTASGMKEEVEMAASTFNDMLIKPVTKQALFNIIAKYISYTDKEESDDMKNNSHSEISVDLKNEVRRLVEENDLLEIEYINIEIIRFFSESLLKSAGLHKNDDLEKIAQNLLSHCNSFNVDGIEKYMGIISKLYCS